MQEAHLDPRAQSFRPGAASGGGRSSHELSEAIKQRGCVGPQNDSSMGLSQIQHRLQSAQSDSACCLRCMWRCQHRYCLLQQPATAM